ncbi:MAG: LCP family protein, partial [Phormidesmis sp.]
TTPSRKSEINSRVEATDAPSTDALSTEQDTENQATDQASNTDKNSKEQGGVDPGGVDPGGVEQAQEDSVEDHEAPGKDQEGTDSEELDAATGEANNTAEPESIDKNRIAADKNGAAAQQSTPRGLPGALVIRPQTPAKKRWGLRGIVRNALMVAAFGATAFTAAGLGAIAVLTFPLPRHISGETVAPPLTDLWRTGFRYQVSRPVNILVMGLDEAHDVEGAAPDDLVGRTDTMLLVRVDPEAKAVNVMSIPRDTRVDIPGYGPDKINQANFEGGAELAAQTVTHNFNNVSIDRYVRVSTTAFKEIVDLVGGIEVLVPSAMQYEDKTQGLVIDLQPGLQNLNGDEAEQFARFRQDSYGDIGRVQRQQILLKALRQQLTTPAVLPKLPQILRVLQSRVDTNLSLEELLALAGFGLDLEPDDLHMVMLPGRFSDPEEYRASYWLSDHAASSDIMRTYFDAESTELVVDDSLGVNYYEPPSPRVLSGLKIAIQNATDDSYASSSMADYLREQGFYNVYVIRNWADVNRETSVVAQRGDIGSANALKDELALGQVISDSTGDIDSDITIRVGEDWLQLIDPEWQRLPYDGPR